MPGDSDANGAVALAAPLSDERVEQILRVLGRAVARACPAELRAMREDLVQSALLRVLERERPGEANAARPASYLWRVAFSVVVDELRRLRRRKPVRDAEQAMDETSAAPRPDLGLAIRACLSGLSEPRRLAVTLHLQGFGSDEASRVLGWDRKRVRNLVFRGMADLRRCLAAKGLP